MSEEALVAHINRTCAASMWEALDITLVRATRDQVVATMPIGTQHRQQVGYLHGGVSAVLAESIASPGTVLHLDWEKQLAFGLEINGNHVRPKREGRITAVGVLLHRGRPTQIGEIRISDEQNKLICISRCTGAIVDRSPEEEFVSPGEERRER